VERVAEVFEVMVTDTSSIASLEGAVVSDEERVGDFER